MPHISMVGLKEFFFLRGDFKGCLAFGFRLHERLSVGDRKNAKKEILSAHLREFERVGGLKWEFNHTDL